jgi:receptor protein-tyrosine kinase
VTASGATGADFVTISATASTPDQAARIANAFVTGYDNFLTAQLANDATNSLRLAQQQLQSANNNPAAKKDLQDRIRRLKVIQALPAGRVQQTSPAVPSTVPTSPQPKRNAAFALVLSLVLAVLAAFGLDRLDRRIRRTEDVEGAYQYPVLAEIPHAGRPHPTHKGQIAIAKPLKEAFRALHLNITLGSLDRPVRTLLVTSAVPLEGKTTVVRNLALAYREAGLRVAVIDADLRQPGVHRVFNVERDPGLTDVLTGRESLHAALQEVPVDVRGLETLARVHMAADVAADAVANAASGNGGEPSPRPSVGALFALASGPSPANPPAVLGAERTQAVLREVAEEYDVVIVDGPPLLPVSDAMPLLSMVDGVIVVGRLDRTTTVAARRLARQVGRVPDARVLGVVVNDVSERTVRKPSYPYDSKTVLD